MDPLELTNLKPLMAVTSGSTDIVIGLIDGPVATDHPALCAETHRFIRGRDSCCAKRKSSACRHGTFIAGILNAKRNSRAPALCPGCTLLVRPVFHESIDNADVPSATPAELAAAIRECVDHGARVVNLSIALDAPSPDGDRKLTEALDYAQANRTVVAAAAGNHGMTGGSALTRHPWVIPVAACDLSGAPARYSNRTGLMLRRGLRAPGEKVTSLGTDQRRARFGGTSTAVPFVTGTIALLWSEFPEADAGEIRAAVTAASLHRRRPAAPPLLNAWRAYLSISGRAKRKAA